MSGSDSEGEIFEIEEILEKRGRGKSVEYLIRWKGFGESEDSWEPARNISSATEVIAVFNEKREKMKTPRRQSKGRSGAGDNAQVEEMKTVEKSTKSSSEGESTRTVTTTKTFTQTQTKMAMSDTSSPEASPTVTRKSLRPRPTPATKQLVASSIRSSSSSAASGGGRFKAWCQIPKNALGGCCCQFSVRDLPIMILVTCLLVIGSSFYIAGK